MFMKREVGTHNLHMCMPRRAVMAGQSGWGGPESASVCEHIPGILQGLYPMLRPSTYQDCARMCGTITSQGALEPTIHLTMR